MSNHLIGQTSPYLLQHAENPVNWYPWCDEAFGAAREQDKPVFLSIGYSTCHWCHVMAHESFEDREIAELLNRYFISIKVDKEERPDVDSVYMAVCQAFTGGGGWPMSIFMTPERKPFFAGTYFPKTTRRGAMGLRELLMAVSEKWQNDRKTLLRSADEIVSLLNQEGSVPAEAEEGLLETALDQYRRSFDEKYGGFGAAPKFPAPHNLLFLMRYYVKHGDENALRMVEMTLRQMYRGGIFDHIGYGFCRYSTDRRFLVPHFEKMLYDNALLIQAYAMAFEITGEQLYLNVAEKTAQYTLNEMRSPAGGYFSAQDADSDGEEGKYYTFTPDEIKKLLGEKEGQDFCARFDITDNGNFEGKSIPNLLCAEDLSDRYSEFLPMLRAYRRERARLHTDDKILTSWNAFMIAGLCQLYRASKREEYLTAAKQTLDFIKNNLQHDGALHVSWRDGKRGKPGFLDDYAGYIYALLAMYDVTLNKELINAASVMADKAVNDFFDEEKGGFYLYGKDNEPMITRPKESYDGAIPSGNSLMTYNLVRLNMLLPDEKREKTAEKQMRFMAGEAKKYPMGYAMYLTALSDLLEPPMMITAVLGGGNIAEVIHYTQPGTVIRVVEDGTNGYRTIDGQTAFYVCRDKKCMPPVNKEGLFDKYFM